MLQIKSVSILAIAFGLSCGPTFAQNAPSFIADGELSVCVDPTFPPLEFLEKPGDKVPVGFDVDLANALANQWNAKTRFISMDFNGLLPSLEAGRCDTLISGAYITPEREQKFDAVGYLQTNVVLIGKPDMDVMSNSDAIAGKTIAVQSGTDFVARLEALQKELAGKGLDEIQIQQYPKQTDALQQLLVGRADLIVTQDTEVAYREVQSPGQFKILYTFPESEIYAAFFAKNPDDKAAFETAMKNLKSASTLLDLLKKWKLPEDRISSIGN